MRLKDIISQLNIAHEVKKYGIPLWQSPQFLFAVMGIIIIASILVSYFLGIRYIGDPVLSILLIFGLALIQLVLAFFITQSFERLIEASRMKAEFVSIVSHQLRAPLTNLRWAVDFLSKGTPETQEKQESYMQIIAENTLRMHELVNDLLIVSRLEQGKLPFRRQKFSLEELVQEVVEEFGAVLQASNIKLEIQGEEHMPHIFSDAPKIRQIIVNFIDNAIRYIKKGSLPDGKEKNIVIRYKKTDGTVRLEVEDNGIGIPKEDQKYIFNKFFRSRNAVRHETQGSGLGLYIAKSMIEKTKGGIGFQSEEQKGSTFWFTLPIK
ncbi:HAMP domain-containing histidine kinase [Patescibacteria group bacterium]|nr:HAMP domain-containing histidine kinase [Patescibacteria group bacterium]